MVLDTATLLTVRISSSELSSKRKRSKQSHPRKDPTIPIASMKIQNARHPMIVKGKTEYA
jgi:hypothetical protein